jgi:hypothetical protein
MFAASRNVLNLDKLIKEVDSKMADLHLRVSSTQLALAVEMDTKIDKMMEMMEKMAAGAHDKEDPADMDPHVLAEIAKQAGMEAGKAMQDELGAMSAKMMTKMDEIADAVQGKIAYHKAPMFPCCSILTLLSTAVFSLPSHGQKTRQHQGNSDRVYEEVADGSSADTRSDFSCSSATSQDP